MCGGMPSLLGSNKSIIDNILTIEEGKGFLTLKGLLKPMEVGEERDREIQVYLDWGKSQDTVTVKRNRDDQYPQDYELIKDQS